MENPLPSHSHEAEPPAPAVPEPAAELADAGCPFRELERARAAGRPSRPPLEGMLGGLARSLGLDVYGESLLSRRAALEMKYAGLLLSIVALFELAAWTLLFNSILQSDLLRINGTTLLAVLPASLFASAVLIYERQFLTTDLRPESGSRFARLALPTALRLAVIGASALITAQPVELLVFRAQIEAREHEEGIRREVVTRRRELLRAQEEEAQRRQDLRRLQTGELLLRSDRRLEENEERLRAERDRGPEVRQRLESAQGSVNYWDGELRKRRRALETLDDGAPDGGADDAAARRAELEAAVTEARRNRNAWAARRDQARIDREVQEQRLSDLQAEIETTRTTASDERRDFADTGAGERAEAEAEQERLFRWIRLLRQTPPGADRILEPVTGTDPSAALDRFVYLPPAYDFFEKLRVLHDLRRGYSARWPGLETGEARELAALYGLQDVRPCLPQARPEWPAPDLDPNCDPEAWVRLLHQRDQFNRSYWAVFGIALIIPLLVIAFKLLMTGELAAYYSSAYQAAAGERSAVELARSRSRVEAG